MESFPHPAQVYDNPIVAAGYDLLERIHGLRARVRELYFEAMLFLRSCPQCGVADLAMISDSWSRCASCEAEFDPTLAFLRCMNCESTLQKKISHYWCPVCRHPVVSPYCFEARVFDRAYFREKMRESRQRTRTQREAIKRMLAQARSAPLESNREPSLDDVPDLAPELDAFIGQAFPAELIATYVRRPDFDLQRYQAHILGLVRGCLVQFEGVMPLLSDRRLDRIFRFIAVIYLEHEGRVSLTQTTEGEIMIEDHETH